MALAMAVGAGSPHHLARAVEIGQRRHAHIGPEFPDEVRLVIITAIEQRRKRLVEPIPDLGQCAQEALAAQQLLGGKAEGAAAQPRQGALGQGQFVCEILHRIDVAAHQRLLHPFDQRFRWRCGNSEFAEEPIEQRAAAFPITGAQIGPQALGTGPVDIGQIVDAIGMFIR